MMIQMMILLVLVVLVQQLHGTSGQQPYVNNKQLDCENNYSVAAGFVCNGAASSCLSYLTFRSTPLYNSAPNIAYLLDSDASEIARINNISDVNPIPTDTLLIVPSNCSCFSTSAINATNSVTTSYYQHNASYTLKTTSETYFSVANNTYEGLTTCQSLIAQNPSYNFRNLLVGMKLEVPLRCACPTRNQTNAGFKYLLTYLITWQDTIEDIANKFGADNQSVFEANQLTPDSIIFPFTPILVPLKSEPKIIETILSPPPPPSPQLPANPVGNQSNSSSRKWVFVGAGVGGAVLLLVVGFLFFFFLRRSRSRRRRRQHRAQSVKATPPPESANEKPWSVSLEGVQYAVGSLTVYKYEEIEKATGFFGEANRIKGSVYRGCFMGDNAAVKIMKGDVSDEINILKQINHSNIIRLSGFCVHDGKTYLVYEYTENGSLSDWLHTSNSKSPSPSTIGLSWKQRVQIAYDVADALNYLHNYTNPPYIHKNMKSSNILLDGELRAKVANFGLARSLQENQDLHMTRHVVGTYGYMAPEYIENGLVTPKLDVYAFGVVMLELLSGREPASGGSVDKNKKSNGIEEGEEEEEELLSVTIVQVVGGENVRGKLQGFIDPHIGQEYPLDLAYSFAQLAKKCVDPDVNSRPAMAEVFMILSKILSSSMDWDPSIDNAEHSTNSLSYGR